jgi:hypothetical protein
LLNMEVFTWMIGNFQTSKSLNVREREYSCLCSYYVINTYTSLMYELKKMERYLRVSLLGPGPSSYKKIIYRAAVSQKLGNTGLVHITVQYVRVMLTWIVWLNYFSSGQWLRIEVPSGFFGFFFHSSARFISWQHYLQLTVFWSTQSSLMLTEEEVGIKSY